MALPLDGYVRVSRVGARGKAAKAGAKAEGFISPEVQEAEIRKWAERKGVEVAIQPHELNVSGGTMDRPIFNKIMERIRRGESGGVVVYKLDRFARSLIGAVNTLAELGEHKATFASATEPELDYTTPAGEAFLNMQFTFAQFVRSTLKESWAVTARHKIEEDGVHISPVDYLGYDKVEGRLVPNDQAPVASEAFHRRGGGEGWGAIADWLNEVAPKPNEREWIGQAVQRLCAKRVYRGEASRYVEQDIDGRGPIINRDAHPALVTEREWQAAQMNPRIAKGGANGKPLPLLSGLIRCAGCRYSMSVGRGSKGERMYRCRGRHASGRCPAAASITAEAVEHYIEAHVLAEIEGVAKMVPDSGERERASAELEQARAGLEDFRRDREARRKLGPEWHEWLDEYLAAVREAEARLGQLDQRAEVAREGLTRDHFLDLPGDERREVLAGFMDCVFVRRSRGRGRNVDPIDTRARILWRGQAPPDLPRRRVVNPIISFDIEADVEAGVVAAQDGA